MDLSTAKSHQKVVRTPQLELLKFVFGIVRGGYNTNTIFHAPGRKSALRCCFPDRALSDVLHPCDLILWKQSAWLHLFFLSRKSATARSKSAMPVESNTVMSVSLLRPAAFPRIRSPSSPQIRSSNNVPCFKGISISPAFLQCSRSSTKTMASSKETRSKSAWISVMFCEISSREDKKHPAFRDGRHKNNPFLQVPHRRWNEFPSAVIRNSKRLSVRFSKCARACFHTTYQ